MTRLIATFFYAGLLRPGPGTWGSLAALPALWLLHVIGGPVLVVIAGAALFAAGVWAARAETARAGDSDPGHVVVDEVVGQWIALLPVTVGAARVDANILSLWPGWAVAFLAFRAFDIWKIGPVARADRRGDVWGLMLDDVIAGLIAAIVVVAFGILFHVVLL